MSVDRAEMKSWLSMTEAAQELGVTPATLRRWADQGAVPHMITPGGHRRFATSDIVQFTESRKRAGRGPSPETLWAEMALKQTRTEIVSRQQEPWLVAFGTEDRERKRLLGRELMGLLLRYVSSDEESSGILDQAEVIGRAHAATALRVGLPLRAAVEAMMFFHATLVEAALDLPDTNRTGSEANKRLLRRITTLLNTVQLAMVDVYDRQSSAVSTQAADYAAAGEKELP